MPGTEIPTDLLTPLGAYLSLREDAAGAFLLESVERGRLGRYSFVGAGSRLVSFAEAETLGEPVVGGAWGQEARGARRDRQAAHRPLVDRAPARHAAGAPDQRV